MPFPPVPKFVVFCGLAALLAGLSSGPQVLADETPPARLAVIGDAESQDLSILIGKELSGRPEVALVEREDLSRLGDERKLELLAGNDAVALGKLVGADGLLFLNKTATGFAARFTAVGLGYALFDDPLSATRDLGQLARSLAHRVAGYAPKLKLDPARAVPLSILNLRADYATPQSTTLERDLTLLLESRLAAVPEYVVLERRHAWSLGFEHALDPAAKPLLRGAYLIDGTLDLPTAPGGDLTVALRVRPPGGTAVTTPLRGTAGDLPALVDRMLPEIARITGKPVAAPSPGPEQESAEYFREGLWGWRAKANRAALEALDSAELLGAPVAAVEAVRIPVLYALVEEGMERWTPWFDDEKRTPAFDEATLAGKTELALRAVREAARYQDEKLEGQLPPDLPSSSTEKFFFRTGENRDRVVYRASKLLLLLDRANALRADELRRALRTLTKYDPLHGHAGLATATYISNDVSRAVFADTWAQTLEEEQAYYRLVCTDKNMALPTSQMGWQNERFGARFFRDKHERQQAFATFVDSLRDQPDSRLSYLILKTRLDDPAAADEACRALLGELWTRRETLAAARTNLPVLWILYSIPGDVRGRHVPEGLPLLRYLFNYPQPGSWCFTLVKFLWSPAEFPEADAPAIWEEFGAFRERLRPVWLAEKHSEKGFERQTGEMADAFRAKFPRLAGEPPPSAAPSLPPLVVTRYWHPWLTPDTLEGNFIITATEPAPDGGMWLAGYFSHGIKGRLYKIALPDFRTEVIESPDDQMASAIQVGTDALYTNRTSSQDGGTELRNHLSRYDFATRSWETRELPLQFRQNFRLLHRGLYLIVQAFGGGYDEKESGLARYDWQSGEMTILASSRRRPGRNQFDDTAPYEIRQVFLGPGDRPGITTGTGTFYVREDAGEWPRVFDGTFGDYATRVGDRTLLSNGNHEITVLDPREPAPLHVMAAAAPFHRHGPALEASPWAEQAWWDDPGKMGIGQLAWHDGCLFTLLPPKEKRGPYELWCYRKDKGRQPRRIALKFQMDAALAAALPDRPGRLPNGWTLDEIEHPDTSFVPPGLSTTGEGLCFRSISTGFWFLPYGDIDAYLASGAE